MKINNRTCTTIRGSRVHSHLGYGNITLQNKFLISEKYFFDVGDCCLEELICKRCDYLDLLSCEFVDCPLESPCIPSNLYCVPEELGDGICQDHNNGEFCDYDLGDCCLIDESAYETCCQCTGHSCIAHG